MKDAIGYRRVSTREQGRSGLGLAAQRDDIKRFAAHEGFTIRVGIRISRPAPAGMPCCCAQAWRAR